MENGDGKRKAYLPGYEAIAGKFRKFGVRDLIWLMLTASLWFGWAVDRDVKHQRYERETNARNQRQIIELTAEVDKLRDENRRFRMRDQPSP